jgi:hypothetical protein
VWCGILPDALPYVPDSSCDDPRARTPRAMPGSRPCSDTRNYGIVRCGISYGQSLEGEIPEIPHLHYPPLARGTVPAVSAHGQVHG